MRSSFEHVGLDGEWERDLMSLISTVLVFFRGNISLYSLKISLTAWINA